MLQPLSLLTFNLDLLFQHHRLEPDSTSPEIPVSQCQDAGFQSTKGSLAKVTDSRHSESLSDVDFGSPEHQTAIESFSPLAYPKNGRSGEPTHFSAAPLKTSITLSHTSPQLLWVQEKEIGELPPPDVDEDSFAQQAGQVVYVPVILVSIDHCVILPG